MNDTRNLETEEKIFIRQKSIWYHQRYQVASQFWLLNWKVIHKSTSET